MNESQDVWKSLRAQLQSLLSDKNPAIRDKPELEKTAFKTRQPLMQLPLR